MFTSLFLFSPLLLSDFLTLNLLFLIFITFHTATAFPVSFRHFLCQCMQCVFFLTRSCHPVFTFHPAGQFIWEQNCELVAASVPSSPGVNVKPGWLTTVLSACFPQLFPWCPVYVCSPWLSGLQSHLPLSIFCISAPWVRHACSSATPLMPSQESIFPQCEYRNGNYSCVSELSCPCVSVHMCECVSEMFLKFCVWSSDLTTTLPMLWWMANLST